MIRPPPSIESRSTTQPKLLAGDVRVKGGGKELPYHV